MENNPSSSGNNNIYINSNNSSGKNESGTLVVNRIRSSHRFPTSDITLYDKETSPLDEVRKIRPTRNNLDKVLTKYQSVGHLTPVKKRSSLARPVRVHDSFLQPRRSMADEDHRQDPQREQQAGSYKNPWWWEHRDQEPNTSNYAYHRDTEDGNAGWPIRLRLEQMLELTLPQTKRKKKKKKKKKATTAAAAATMMLMKQQQRSRHGFKDTERLLKVLSINNVDQDNRYNVKRCSVM